MPGTGGRTVALSGELGSGKSSVSTLLADALGARRVSTGEAQRQIAAQRGISTLELNRLSETDPTIDEEIDSVFRSLASVSEPLVVDSRLAWHFLPHSFKVHLVVDPEEGARRVLGRTDASAERYSSLPEALEKIADRVDSERRRFRSIYGIDIFDLHNYDLVIDTSQASPEQVTVGILDHLAPRVPGAGGPALLLAPRRVVSTRTEGAGAGADPTPGAPADGGPAALTVVYRRPVFEVVAGASLLQAALDEGRPLVPAVLAG
jgi:predicted cytidylate kinase